MSDDKKNPSMEELVSALMDGEANDFETRRVISESTKAGSALSDTWSRYHIIKAALHKELPESVGVDLSARISEALQDEADFPIDEDHDAAAEVGVVAGGVAVNSVVADDTKGLGWVWKYTANAAVAASVAFAVIFGWQNLQSSNFQNSTPQLAQSSGASLPNPNPNSSSYSNSNNYYGSSSSANYFVGSPQLVQYSGSQSGNKGRQRYFDSRNTYRSNAVSINSASVPTTLLHNDGSLELLLGNSFGKQTLGKQLTSKPVLSAQHQKRLNSYFVTHTGQAALNTSSGMMPYVRVVSLPVAEKK